MPSSLQSADRLVAPAVSETLAALDLAPEDAAAAKLAERYAAALDRASGMEASAARVLDAAAGDEELSALVAALKQRVSAQAVLDGTGPKLLAVLESLGATPAARAKAGKGGGRRGPSRLADLRAAGA